MRFFFRKKPKYQAQPLNKSLVFASQLIIAPSDGETLGPPLSQAYPWSARQLNLFPPIVLNKPHSLIPSSSLRSPFPRYGHAVTSATSTDVIYLFGGLAAGDKLCNDLYFISARDNSGTLVQTEGTIPQPRLGHATTSIEDRLIVFGGDTQVSGAGTLQGGYDATLYSLDLSESKLRICV